MTDEQIKKWIKRGVISLILLILILAANPLVIVNPGNRGIVTRLGAVEDRVLGEGVHFITPFVEHVKEIEVRTRKEELDALAYSKDIQTVNTKVALNYHLDAQTVNKLWQEIGGDYRARIIDPAVQESVKAAVAKFTAQELIEARPKVKDEIRIQLSERFTGRHIVVDDFSIVNFDFSDSYEQAIEAKQVAQQNALKAENELQRIKIEAEQRVAQAKAEAEAIKIQAQAITQQGGADYVKLKAIEKWKGEVPQTMIPGASVPFIDLNTK